MLHPCRSLVLAGALSFNARASSTARCQQELGAAVPLVVMCRYMGRAGGLGTQHHLLLLSPSQIVVGVNSVCWLCGWDLQPPELPPAVPGQAEVMVRGCQGWAAAWLLGAWVLQMKGVELGFLRALWAAGNCPFQKLQWVAKGGRSDNTNSPVSLPVGLSALLGSQGDGSSSTPQHPSPDITFPEVPAAPPLPRAEWDCC